MRPRWSTDNSIGDHDNDNDDDNTIYGARSVDWFILMCVSVDQWWMMIVMVYC
jgi:hypothetical protein